MYIYIIVILATLFFTYIAQKNKTKENEIKKLSYYISITISFFILFLFLGLRYKVGFDYSYTYVPQYYNIIRGKNTHFEFLFVCLNKFVYFFFDNVDWVFIISAFITVFIVYNIICKRINNIVLGVFLYIGTRMYLYSFTQVRQYIAIAIFLFAIKYIVEKKMFRYFFWILIASLIHKTAILYLPVYFVRNINLSHRKYIMIAVVAIFCAPIVNILYNYVGNYLYGWYISNEIGLGNSSIVMGIINLFVIILSILFYNKVNTSVENRILLNIQLIAWVAFVTTQSLNESYRIVALFMYTSILLIPKIYETIKYKNNKRVVMLMIIILFSLCIYVYLENDASMIPYRTIFDKYN